MKVIAINGSPKSQGNTYLSLVQVGKEIQSAGIEFEIIHIGNKAIRGCMACGSCKTSMDDRCAITGDEVNECIQKLKAADGILLGVPVHYAGIAGTMKCFLDRVFYVAGANSLFRHKVGASVVSLRRTGGIAAFDSLNHYINYSEMILPGSNYWNVIHGSTPGEVLQDAEGQQILSVLGRNMAWLIHALAAAKLQAPPAECKVRTNFIR